MIPGNRNRPHGPWARPAHIRVTNARQKVASPTQTPQTQARNPGWGAGRLPLCLKHGSWRYTWPAGRIQTETSNESLTLTSDKSHRVCSGTGAQEPQQQGLSSAANQPAASSSSSKHSTCEVNILLLYAAPASCGGDVYRPCICLFLQEDNTTGTATAMHAVQ